MNGGQIADAWEQGDSYEYYVGRWSRRIAPVFLTWLNAPVGQRWLDVGCGTGTLCSAILDRCAPASVTGVEPSQGFLTTARKHLGGRAILVEGSATQIPLESAAADVVVSGLVLNFVADQPAALAEMIRVARPGGAIGAYVWDYAQGMQMMRLFWDAAAELDPAAAQLDEGVRFPVCNPDALTGMFAGAGLEEVDVTAIDIPMHFQNFDDYWLPFMGGQGPAPAYVASLSISAQAQLREQIRERLTLEPDGSIRLLTRAWAVQARIRP